MLIQLLAIKRRRERGLRATLATLADEQEALRARQEALHARRQALCEEWRRQAAQSGCFNHHQLAILRAYLARLEGEDQALKRELEGLARERMQLAHTQAEHELRLTRTLREQEKLTLLESELDE